MPQRVSGKDFYVGPAQGTVSLADYMQVSQ